MGPIALRSSMHRRRHHVAVALAMILIAAVVALHHSDVGTSDMGGMHHDNGASMVEMCVATFAAVGAVLVAVVFGLVGLGRWPWLRPLVPHQWSAVRGAPTPRPRAGPDLLRLFCVWLR